MWSFEAILTLAILLAAVAWAGRKLYRWTRRAATRTEVTGCVAGCESQHEGCGHCPAVTLVVDREASIDPEAEGGKD